MQLGGMKLKNKASSKVAVRFQVPARGQLTSTFAYDQFVHLAKDMSEMGFILFLVPTFGTDIEPAVYGKLYRAAREGSLSNPAIEVLPGLVYGHEAGYDRKSRTIKVSKKLADAATGDGDDAWKLLSALTEEFGHHLDHLLRNEYSTIGGDADDDEGAILAYDLISFDFKGSDSVEFAHYKSSRHDGPLRVEYAEVHEATKRWLSKAEQRSDDKAGDVEFFGAGRGEPAKGVHGHQSIEDVLADVGFSEKERLQIYYGNWLRDFSQIIDPGLVRPMNEYAPKAAAEAKKRGDPCAGKDAAFLLSREGLTKLVGVLAAVEFNFGSGFRLSEDELGVYRSEEHIDNPKPPGPPESWQDNSHVHPAFAPAPIQLQLDFDAAGMKNYIATRVPGQSCDTAVEYMQKQLKEAIRLGRSKDGFRHFGSALHVLEDYFSHSNFVELSLRKLGHDVVAWVPIPKQGRAKLVTGRFGQFDVIASVFPKLADTVFPNHFENYKPPVVLPNGEVERTPAQKIVLIILQDLAKAQETATKAGVAECSGRDYAQWLDYYRTFLKTMDEFAKAEHDYTAIQWFNWLLHHTMGRLNFVVGWVFNYLLNTVALNVDEAQFYFDTDPNSTDPTHSQLAKDHGEHPLHGLAAQLAKEAVKKVGLAMRDAWAGKPADPVKIARSYIVHPADTTWMEPIVKDWAKNNPTKLKEALYPTWVEHARQEYQEFVKNQRAKNTALWQYYEKVRKSFE